MKKLLALLFASSLFFSSCIQQRASAPELIEPAGVVFDTVSVKRMDLKKSNYYQGYVAPYSVGVAFTESDTYGGESHVISGDYVKKGDLLYSADIEKINEEIDDYLRQIAKLEESCNDRNTLSSLDAQIAKLEGRDHDAERYQLEIKHRNEKLALDKELVQEKLNLLLIKAENYQLFSPIDGVVIVVSGYGYGHKIERYKEIIFIADESKITIKLFESMPFLSSGIYPTATALANGKRYALENLETSFEERMRLYAMELAPVTEYKILEGIEDFAPGDTVEVEVNDFLLNDVLCVPINAVFGVGINAYVYVVKDGEKIYRSVQTGNESRTHTQILSGLEEGEIVYVRQ